MDAQSCPRYRYIVIRPTGYDRGCSSRSNLFRSSGELVHRDPESPSFLSSPIDFERADEVLLSSLRGRRGTKTAQKRDRADGEGAREIEENDKGEGKVYGLLRHDAGGDVETAVSNYRAQGRRGPQILLPSLRFHGVAPLPFSRSVSCLPPPPSSSLRFPLSALPTKHFFIRTILSDCYSLLFSFT